MKKINIKSEVILLAVSLIPLVYLCYIWNDLPTRVAIHWDASAEPDGYGTKAYLWLLPATSLFTYVCCGLGLFFDSNGQIAKLGKKFDILRLLIIMPLSLFMLAAISASKANSTLENGSILILGSGLMVTYLGNFLKTVQVNNTVGIRTFHTLNNKQVWKLTHQLGGWLFFIGGIVISVSALIIKESNIISLLAILLTIVIGSALVCIIYAAVKYKQLNEK